MPAPLAASQPQAPPSELRIDRRPFATPYVRALALERGIDITDLHPSGGRLRIDITDLEVHAETTPLPSATVTSVVEVDVTLAVRQAQAGGAPLLVLLIQAVARALPHPASLRVLRYSKTGHDSTLITNAADLSLEGIECALTERDEGGLADFVIVDVASLDLLNTTLVLDEARTAALSMGVVLPRVAIGVGDVIAFRSAMQLTLTYDAKLLEMATAARLLSTVRRYLERKPEVYNSNATH